MIHRLCCKVTESSVQLSTLNLDIRNPPGEHRAAARQSDFWFSGSKIWKLSCLNMFRPNTLHETEYFGGVTAFDFSLLSGLLLFFLRWTFLRLVAVHQFVSAFVLFFFGGFPKNPDRQHEAEQRATHKHGHQTQEPAHRFHVRPRRLDDILKLRTWAFQFFHRCFQNRILQYLIYLISGLWWNSRSDSPLSELVQVVVETGSLLATLPAPQEAGGVDDTPVQHRTG